MPANLILSDVDEKHVDEAINELLRKGKKLNENDCIWKDGLEVHVSEIGKDGEILFGIWRLIGVTAMTLKEGKKGGK